MELTCSHFWIRGIKEIKLIKSSVFYYEFEFIGGNLQIINVFSNYNYVVKKLRYFKKIGGKKEMAKLKDVIIVNNHTLRLESDAFKGDEIDLMELTKVDLNVLSKKIDSALDVEYEKRLRALNEKFQTEKKMEVLQATKDLDKEIDRLKAEKANIALTKDQEFQIKLLSEKNNYENKIKDKENEINKLKAHGELELQNKLQKIESDYEIKLSKLQSDKDSIAATIKAELKVAHSDETMQLQKKIDDLARERSARNIKKIGEDLENWCHSQYESYAQSGFQTCTWEKDNISIKTNEEDFKGTKADFVFKVYATEDKKEEDLLTSVACEMKSEDPASVNKKKNEDHYKKLNKDRIKKNCEYALLVSELEWETDNDVPIKKVPEYEKMYMVRPQYFITFLSIIASLGLKYKDLIIATNEEKEKFKEILDIENEFEEMKRKLLEDPIVAIEKEVEKINAEANKIAVSAEKIMRFSDAIVSRGIEKIRNRIENYNITRITKKIDKLED